MIGLVSLIALMTVGVSAADTDVEAQCLKITGKLTDPLKPFFKPLTTTTHAICKQSMSEAKCLNDEAKMEDAIFAYVSTLATRKCAKYRGKTTCKSCNGMLKLLLSGLQRQLQDRVTREFSSFCLSRDTSPLECFDLVTKSGQHITDSAMEVFNAMGGSCAVIPEC